MGQPSVIQQYVIAGLALVIGLLTGYLKSYWDHFGAKKGELQALHEGIDKTLKQVNGINRRH